MNVVTAEMLIRQPRESVFDAFVTPSTLEKFWLKRASGPLRSGASVEWEFMVDGARETVIVTEFIENEVIGFMWSTGIRVTIQLDAHESGDTKASITATGFTGTDALEGFTIVLCDLKSLLETGRSGGMVRDKAALISAAMA